MEHGLIKTGFGALARAEDLQGAEALLKPLTREIHLFDTFVSGTARLADPAVLEGIRVGDRLTLRREKNKFDECAIRVLTPSGEKLGYIPEKDDQIFARLLDAGKVLCAQIQSIDRGGSFCQIAIGIYLVDF